MVEFFVLFGLALGVILLLVAAIIGKEMIRQEKKLYWRKDKYV